MPDYLSRISNVNPAYPVRPARKGKRDAEKKDKDSAKRDGEPPGNDEPDTDQPPTIDELV